MRSSTVVVLMIIAFLILNAIFIWTNHLPFNAEGFGIIIAAGLTLAIYSFLYKDNPAFKFTEHLYIGVAIGYTMVIDWHQNLIPNLINPLFYSKDVPVYSLIIPMTLGILMFSRFFQSLIWLSRWTIAFMVGWGAGVAIPRSITENILAQANSAVKPLLTDGNVTWASASALICFIGVLTVLFYFFFSLEHKGAAGRVSRIGVWFLMISFGASFGFTVMARMALLIGRVWFLLGDWLRVL